MLIRSISGLRGITDTPDGLSSEAIIAYASAFATMLGGSGTVALGYDGRLGGNRIYELVAETLAVCGCDVMGLGMVPTPTVMFAVEKESGVKGGIAVTASHNPQEWNGMKFIASTGLFLDKAENEALWKIVDERSWNSDAPNGDIVDATDVVAKHVEAVLAIPYLAKDLIAGRRLKVVLDAVNASGSHIQQELISRLGAVEVIGVATDGSGLFPHMPEPVPQNLKSLCQAVLEHGADIGIAVDPDADRCVLITETGEPFIEENTIVLAVEEVLSNNPPGQHVVVNLSTTRAVDDIAKQYGATVHRTPVGEINVAKKMIEVGAIIGGEGSGGVIYPDVHTGRDSLVAVALALSNLARSGMTLSEKRKSLPQYEIVKSKITLKKTADALPVIAKIKAQMAPSATAINEEDGLRMEFGNTWLHVRASNTEPIMRIIAEAPTKSEAESLIARAQAV